MLFKKSTLFLVIAIQILLAVSFVSAQTPDIIKQQVSLVIDGVEAQNFKDVQHFSDPNSPSKLLFEAIYQDLEFIIQNDPGFKAGDTLYFELKYYTKDTHFYENGCYGRGLVKSVTWNPENPYVLDEIDASITVLGCQYRQSIIDPTGTFSIIKEVEVCEADQELIDENTNLKSSIEVLNAEIDRLLAGEVQDQIRIKNLNADLNEARTRIDILEQEVAGYTLRYANLKEQLIAERNEFTKQLDLKSKELADALLMLSSKEAELKVALTTNASLAYELTRSKAEVTSLKSQLAKLQSDNLKLKTENAKLLKTIADLKKKLKK